MKNKGGQGTWEIMAGVSSIPRVFPVPCGAMTVIGVSTLPRGVEINNQMIFYW